MKICEREVTIRDEWNMHDGLHRLVVGVQGQEVGGVLGSVSAQVCSVLWSLSREGEVKVVVDEVIEHPA